MAFTINVNGNTHGVDVDGDTPFLWVLRYVLGITGTKFGCRMALRSAFTTGVVIHALGHVLPLSRHPNPRRST